MGDLYLGNPNLKSVGVPVEWTDESVTEFVNVQKIFDILLIIMFKLFM